MFFICSICCFYGFFHLILNWINLKSSFIWFSSDFKLNKFYSTLSLVLAYYLDFFKRYLVDTLKFTIYICIYYMLPSNNIIRLHVYVNLQFLLPIFCSAVVKHYTLTHTIKPQCYYFCFRELIIFCFREYLVFSVYIWCVSCIFPPPPPFLLFPLLISLLQFSTCSCMLFTNPLELLNKY